MLKKYCKALKEKKWVRWLTVTAVGILALLVFAHTATPAARTPPTTTKSATRAWAQPPEEQNLANFARAIRTRSEEAGRPDPALLQELQQELQRTRDALRRMQEEQEQLRRALQERSGDAQGKTLLDDTAEAARVEGGSPAPAVARIRKIEVAPGASKASQASRWVRIPAGTFARARLLTGVYAPVKEAALPVLLKVESIGWGPNGTKLPIRDAFCVGKANGDPNSARAVIQLQTLSLALEDGQSIEVSVNGYVVDSDGIQGVAGTYVYRTSEIVALAATTQGLSRGADALSQRSVSSVIGPLGNVQRALTGDAAEYAGLQAVSGTLDKLSDIVAKRADEITPAVYAPNGKEISVVFIQGVDLPGFEIDETAPNPYQGLDAHR